MQKIFIFITAMVMTFISLETFAKTVTLYEKPEDNAKVVATMNPGDQILSIFRSGDWLEVANPADGKVGWVKIRELKEPVVAINSGGTSIQEKIYINKDKKPEVYRVVEYSGSKQLNAEEVKAMIAKMNQDRERMRKSMLEMHEAMQQMMHKMMNDFDDDFKTFPIIQPMILVPDTANKDSVQMSPKMQHGNSSAVNKK